MDLAVWNAGASACWNRLRTALRRDHPTLEFFRAAEVQKRGALHHHLLIVSQGPLDVDVVQGAAMRAGYGCVLDLQRFPDVRRAARYLAKYVTKDAEPADVPWAGDDVLDTRTGQLRPSDRATYRPWSASRGWGITMRQVRDAIAASVRASIAARQSVTEVTHGAPRAPVISGGTDPPTLF